MSIGSINTNVAAYQGLQNLNAANAALAATRKQVSTGLLVADTTDGTGLFAVAQDVRSDVGALTSVNRQLGTAQGLVTTAVTSLTDISGTVANAKALLVRIADPASSDAERQNYIQSYKSLVRSVADSVDDSSYDGQTLLGSAAGPVTGTGLTVIHDETGSTSTLTGEDASTLPNTLATLIGSTFSRSSSGVDTFGPVTPAVAQSSALAALTSPGPYEAAQSALGTQLSQAGADANAVSARITLNSAKIDSLDTGLGALVDADLSQESALLQAQQVKQQLGTQALSIANQSPQALLSLFKA